MNAVGKLLILTAVTLLYAAPALAVEPASSAADTGILGAKIGDGVTLSLQANPFESSGAAPENQYLDETKTPQLKLGGVRDMTKEAGPTLELQKKF